MANQTPLHKHWFLFTKPLQVEVVCLSNEMVSFGCSVRRQQQLWLEAMFLIVFLIVGARQIIVMVLIC